MLAPKGHQMGRLRRIGVPFGAVGGSKVGRLCGIVVPLGQSASRAGLEADATQVALFNGLRHAADPFKTSRDY